jgi:HEAT repeat protein
MGADKKSRQMTETIMLALETYSEDPVGTTQVLQELIRENPNEFARASAGLPSDQDKLGLQAVIEVLAQSAGVVQQLCDPDVLDKKASIELAQRIAAIDPGLDSKLARLLPGRGVNDSDPAKILAAERILELLDAISVSNRVVPMLAQLVHHPNARLRAKVSLLIARWTRNVRAAEQQLDEPDSRIRANAVEALWGDKTGRVAPLLWRAAKDVDNRVVGNALFALYELKDQEVIPYILSMAGHKKPNFRATAAWTMGQTGDPRFLPALEKLTHDIYAPVRKSAARGIERISKREEAKLDAENSIEQNQ